MKLKHTVIPTELLVNLPAGIKVVNRHDKEFLVIEELYGPNGENLMYRDVRIHGEPSVRISVNIGSTSGSIFLDAFWGSHAKLFSFIPDCSALGSTVEAYVPGTDTSLLTDWKCNIEGCDSDKAIAFYLPGKKNYIHVCAKMGCPGHHIELTDLPKKVSDAASQINFFGEGSIGEDWFDEMYEFNGVNK